MNNAKKKKRKEQRKKRTKLGLVTNTYGPFRRLRQLRQENDLKFSLGNIVRSLLKNVRTKPNKTNNICQILMVHPTAKVW